MVTTLLVPEILIETTLVSCALPTVARVYDQDDQSVIVYRVEDPVVTCDSDPQNPVHPVSIFAPVGLGSSRSDSVAALMRSTTGASRAQPADGWASLPGKIQQRVTFIG